MSVSKREIRALEQILASAIRDGQTLRYRELASRMGFGPPGAIRRVGALLETLMEIDHRQGEPFRASVVVGQGGVPRAGFFRKAAALGRYVGPETGPEAERWHARERWRLIERS